MVCLTCLFIFLRFMLTGWLAAAISFLFSNCILTVSFLLFVLAKFPELKFPDEVLVLRNIGGLRLILKPLYRPLGRWIAYDGHCFNTKVLLLVKRKMYVYLCMKPGTPDSLSYVYIIFNQTHVVPINSRDTLPPYIKNTYPSYPDTDKKRRLIHLININKLHIHG